MAKPLTLAVAKRRISEWESGGWDTLDLSTLTVINDEIAKLIGALEGGVDLRDVTEISDNCAALLRTHKGNLGLGGVKQLSHAAAEALSTHDGWLHLGVTELSDEVAFVLSKGIATLNLTGLTTLGRSPGHLALARKLIENGTFNRLYDLTDVAQEVLDIKAELAAAAEQARSSEAKISRVSGLEREPEDLTARQFLRRCGAAVEEIARAIEREIEFRPDALYNDKTTANYLVKKLRDVAELL